MRSDRVEGLEAVAGDVDDHALVGADLPPLREAPEHDEVQHHDQARADTATPAPGNAGVPSDMYAIPNRRMASDVVALPLFAKLVTDVAVSVKVSLLSDVVSLTTGVRTSIEAPVSVGAPVVL